MTLRNNKTHSILAMSLAVLTAGSITLLVEIPSAGAAKPEKLLKMLNKIRQNEPYFFTNLTSDATVPHVPNDFSGNAKTWLIVDDGQIKLKYKIKTAGV